MLEIVEGMVVVSTQGRDNEHLYIVKNVENGYAYVVDGKQRTIQNPKKKKFKHLRPTGQIIESIQEKFRENQKLLDSEIRKTIDNLSII